MREKIEKARKEQIKLIILLLCASVIFYFIASLIVDDIYVLIGIVFILIYELVCCCYMRIKEYRFLCGLLDDDILADSRFKHRVFNSEELFKQKVASVFEENNSEYFSFSNNHTDKSEDHIVKCYDRKLVLYPIRFFIDIVMWFFLCCCLKIITGASLPIICLLFMINFFIFIGPCRRKFFTKGESFSDGKATIPIKDIIALQILSSKKVSDYQLNLVLKDLTRRSVSCSKALYRMVSLAQVISNFLCIPIVTTESQLLAIYQSKALGLVNTIARNNDTRI